MLLFFLGLVRIFGPSPSKYGRSTNIHILDEKQENNHVLLRRWRIWFYGYERLRIFAKQ